MRQRRLKNEINVVPYIDVMLVLLVIFMVATPMMSTGSVDLPTSGSASSKPDKFLRLEIEKDGALSLTDTNGKTSKMAGLKELQSELARQKEANPKVALLIAGDQGTQYKSVMDALEQAKSTGLEKVSLETRGK